MKLQKIYLPILITLLFTSCDVIDIIRSNWDPDAKAKFAARYDVMKPLLKNPESAKFNNIKIRYKDTTERTIDGLSKTIHRYVISLDLTAENSFGGRATEGYCLALSILPDDKYLVDVSPQKCQRQNPQPEEIEMIKALALYTK